MQGPCRRSADKFYPQHSSVATQCHQPAHSPATMSVEGRTGLALSQLRPPLGSLCSQVLVLGATTRPPLTNHSSMAVCSTAVYWQTCWVAAAAGQRQNAQQYPTPATRLQRAAVGAPVQGTVGPTVGIAGGRGSAVHSGHLGPDAISNRLLLTRAASGDGWQLLWAGARDWWWVTFRHCLDGLQALVAAAPHRIASPCFHYGSRS